MSPIAKRWYVRFTSCTKMIPYSVLLISSLNTINKYKRIYQANSETYHQTAFNANWSRITVQCMYMGKYVFYLTSKKSKTFCFRRNMWLNHILRQLLPIYKLLCLRIDPGIVYGYRQIYKHFFIIFKIFDIIYPTSTKTKVTITMEYENKWMSQSLTEDGTQNTDSHKTIKAYPLEPPPSPRFNYPMKLK